MSEKSESKNRDRDLVIAWEPIVRKVQLGVSGTEGLAELKEMIDDIPPEDRPIKPINVANLVDIAKGAFSKLDVRFEKLEETVCAVFTRSIGPAYLMIELSLHEKVGFTMRFLVTHTEPIPSVRGHQWFLLPNLPGLHIEDPEAPNIAEDMFSQAVRLITMATGVDPLAPVPASFTPRLALTNDKERLDKYKEILWNTRAALLAAGVRICQEGFDVLPKKVEELARMRDQKAELAAGIKQQMIFECKGRDEKIERLEREQNTVFAAIGEARNPGENTRPCSWDAAVEDVQELVAQRDQARRDLARESEAEEKPEIGGFEERRAMTERLVEKHKATRAVLNFDPKIPAFTEERQAAVNSRELKGGEVPPESARTPEEIANHVTSMVCSFGVWPGTKVSQAELLYTVALGALRRMQEISRSPAPTVSDVWTVPNKVEAVVRLSKALVAPDGSFLVQASRNNNSDQDELVNAWVSAVRDLSDLSTSPGVEAKSPPNTHGVGSGGDSESTS